MERCSRRENSPSRALLVTGGREIWFGMSGGFGKQVALYCEAHDVVAMLHGVVKSAIARSVSSSESMMQVGENAKVICGRRGCKK